MIVQRARDSGLYVHESSQMVSMLMSVDLDSHVPPMLYQAVAELLAWLYRLESGNTTVVPETMPKPGSKGTRQGAKTGSKQGKVSG